ncbi:interleukin-1 receptor-like 1 [Pungitius pungitius]|uniref:interleukin-1 receptor-like 1 n=1 Tax=Pungitius pungitius TaxID=134920 RepID=UPI002E128F36
MDASRLVLLVFVVGAASKPSGSAIQCLVEDEETYSLSEGEALYFVPYLLKYPQVPQEQNITWTRKTSNNEEEEDIPTEENQSLYSDGKALFLFSARLNDSGLYTAMNSGSCGHCFLYVVKITVFKKSNETVKELFYGSIGNSNVNKEIKCPEPVQFTCDQLRGNLSWWKDFKSMKGEHRDHLWTTADEGVFTCVCSWTHGGVEYQSLGFMRLQRTEPKQHRNPEIIDPANEQQFAEEGVGIKLKCSVLCGTNVNHCDCIASWHPGGVSPSRVAEYDQNTKTFTQDSANNTISTAVLIIDKVSAEDFNAVFECRGAALFKTAKATLTLKQRESVIPLVVMGVCVLFLFVFAAALVKWFALDLALFFRPCFQCSRWNKDGRMFDAYVVYQAQSQDKVTEDTLTQFIAKILPSVLEEKCGYRLFIHGRDDIPGEDRLEVVEDRMKQSRRLMVILPPGSESESKRPDRHAVSAVIGGYDWQVGLHHALLQREMSVILIQLGDVGPQGYSHLPAGLQHLILKSAPIRWREDVPEADSRNSHFWKRVRYLMPATPAKRCPPSDMI